MFFFLCNKTTKQSCLLTWQSSKLRRIVKSTLDAEILAAVNAADAAYYCQKVLFDVLGHKIPIFEVTDSKSLFSAVSSTSLISDRRLRVDLGYLRELMSTIVSDSLIWTPAECQLADCLTKINRKNPKKAADH